MCYNTIIIIKKIVIMNSPEQIENQKGARMEQEQTSEQIEAAVKEALEKALVFDMVYEGKPGEFQDVRDCVCMMENGGLYISIVEDDGEIGMGIPADMEKIKRVVSKEPFKE